MKPKLEGAAYARVLGYIESLRSGVFPEGVKSANELVAAVMEDAAPDDGRKEFMVTLRGDGFGHEDLCEDGPVEMVVVSHGELRCYAGGESRHLEVRPSAAVLLDFLREISAASPIPVLEESELLAEYPVVRDDEPEESRRMEIPVRLERPKKTIYVTGDSVDSARLMATAVARRAQMKGVAFGMDRMADRIVGETYADARFSEGQVRLGINDAYNDRGNPPPGDCRRGYGWFTDDECPSWLDDEEAQAAREAEGRDEDESEAEAVGDEAETEDADIVACDAIAARIERDGVLFLPEPFRVKTEFKFKPARELEFELVEYSRARGLEFSTVSVDNHRYTLRAEDLPSSLPAKEMGRLIRHVGLIAKMRELGVGEHAFVLNRKKSGGLDPVSELSPKVVFADDRVRVFNSEKDARSVLEWAMREYQAKDKKVAVDVLSGLEPMRVKIPIGCRPLKNLMGGMERYFRFESLKPAQRGELYRVSPEWDSGLGKALPPKSVYVEIPAWISAAKGFDLKKHLAESVKTATGLPPGPQFSHERLPETLEVRYHDGRLVVDSITGDVIECDDFKKRGYVADENGEPLIVGVNLEEWRKFYDYLPDGHPKRLDNLDVSLRLANGKSDEAVDEIRSSGLAWMMCKAVEKSDHEALSDLVVRDGAKDALYDGRSPVLDAAESGDREALDILVAAGCRMDIRDERGRSPEDLLAAREVVTVPAKKKAGRSAKV